MNVDEEAAAFLARMREHYEPPAPKPTNGKHDDERVVFPPETRLAAEFWEVETGGPLGKRLRHIRSAAHARQRSATAILFVVLARMAAGMPHTVMLDAIVGSEQPLTLYVAIVGPPGSGKGDAVSIGGRQLPCGRLPLLIEGVTDHLPPGSGQGIVDVLFDMVEVENDGRKPVKVKMQVRNNAFFEMDEGEALGSLAGQSGSVLLETLRTIWSGKTVGQVNVDAERRRVLPGGTYSYGVVIGVQPAKAAKLIDDDEGGTPQRFLWAPAVDPDIPDATGEIVGPLDWEPPGPIELDRYAVTPAISGEYVRHYVTQDPAITAEVRAHDLGVQRGEITVASLDAHALNMRRRVAALLALLDGSMYVTTAHWGLSAAIMAASNATRDVVLGANIAAAAKEVEKRVRFQSRVRVEGEEASERQWIVACATKIATKVHAEPERWRYASMRRDGITDKERKVYPAAIDHAIEMGWIVVDEIEVVATHGGGGKARPLRPGTKKP